MASQELKVVLTAQDNASKAIASVGDKISGSLKAVSASAAIAGAGLAAFVGTSLNQFSEVGDAVEKMAARTGLATEAVSGLRVAADMGGTSIETVESAIKKMQAQLIPTEDGFWALTDSMREFGVVMYEDFTNMTVAEQFESLAKQIGAIEDPATQAQAAMAAFGKSGVELIPMMEDGSFSMAKWEEEAKKLGVSFDELSAAKAAQLNDAMGAMKLSMQGVQLSIAQALAPAVTQLAELITPMIEKMSAWAAQHPDLTAKIMVATSAVLAMLAVLTPLLATLTALAPVIAFVGTVLGLILSPIGLVVIAIGLLVAAIVFLIANWEAVKAHTLSIWEDIKAGVSMILMSISMTLNSWGASISAALSAIWEALKAAFIAVWDFIVAMVTFYIQGVLAVITLFTDPIIAAWSFLWNTLRDSLSSAMEGIRGLVQSVLEWVESKLGAIRDAAAAVANAVSSVVNKVSGGGGSTKKRALGGPVTSGEGYLVGENGPEWFQPYTSGSITPNNRLGGMSGGVNVTINVARVGSDMDIRRVARLAGDEIMRGLKNNQLLGA